MPESGTTPKVNQNDEPYDPFQHRKVEYPNNDFQALANLLKSSLGSGILAMPLAFKNAGLVVGTIGTIFIGYMCTHCAQILVETSREICIETRTPALGYSETCEEAFANGPKTVRKYSKMIRNVTDFAMAFTYIGGCCVYVVLMTNSIKQLVEFYGGPEISLSLYAAMISLPLMLLVQIKNLKHLAPISFISNILFVMIVVIVFCYSMYGLPPIEERDKFTSITTLPSFLSTVIFAMEGIGIVMHVENAMTKPSHFLGCPGVLNISMVIIILLYGFLGFMGYVRYGDDVKASITLNLHNDYISAQIAKVMIIIAIFFTYGLQFYISMESIWKYCKDKLHKREKLANFSLRITLVILTAIVGALIPKLDSIISLVGAIFYSTLGLFVPAFVQIIYRWDRNLGRLKWLLWKNLFIIVFSLITLVCGVMVTVIDMIESNEVDSK